MIWLLVCVILKNIWLRCPQNKNNRCKSKFNSSNSKCNSKCNSNNKVNKNK